MLNAVESFAQWLKNTFRSIFLLSVPSHFLSRVVSKILNSVSTKSTNSVCGPVTGCLDTKMPFLHPIENHNAADHEISRLAHSLRAQRISHGFAAPQTSQRPPSATRYAVHDTPPVSISQGQPPRASNGPLPIVAGLHSSAQPAQWQHQHSGSNLAMDVQMMDPYLYLQERMHRGLRMSPFVRSHRHHEYTNYEVVCQPQMKQVPEQ